MRVVILAIGSRGDVQPFLALAAGLETAGFETVVATHPPYSGLVDSWGLSYACVGANAAELLESQTVALLNEAGRNPVAWARSVRAVSEEIWNDVVDDCSAACVDADAVVYSILGHPGYSIAEKRGIPSIGAPLQPVTATRSFPHVFAAPAVRSLGSLGNRLSHLVGEQLSWWPVGKLVNEWRSRSLGLDPIPRRGLVRKLRRDRYPIVYGFSPTLVPPPPDWGDWISVTGYWFGSATADWIPPSELETFLATGPAPVFAGFGSVRVTEATGLLDDVCRAARQVGTRLVVTTGGWLGDQPKPRYDEIFLIDEAPHDWLFPRMAALIHHGGSGTTHYGVRSGRPSVIVPTFGDQFFWANRVAMLGASTQPISRKTVTVDRLATAIESALTDENLQERAGEVGTAVDAEDGVTMAVAALQRQLT